MADAAGAISGFVSFQLKRRSEFGSTRAGASFFGRLQAAGARISSANPQIAGAAKQHKSTNRNVVPFTTQLTNCLIVSLTNSIEIPTFAVLNIFFNPTQLISINYVR